MLGNDGVDAFASAVTVRSGVKYSIRTEGVERCHGHHGVRCEDHACTNGGLIDKTAADPRSRVNFLRWGLGVA